MNHLCDYRVYVGVAGKTGEDWPGKEAQRCSGKFQGEAWGLGRSHQGEICGPTSATRKLSEREGGWGMEVRGAHWCGAQPQVGGYLQ